MGDELTSKSIHGDYNDGLLSEPCLRLPYGDGSLASIELGDGTGYVRLSDLVKVKAENSELKELAAAVKEFVEDTHCENCPCRRDCDDNNRIFCANDFSYHAFAAMRELGIEVE